MDSGGMEEVVEGLGVREEGGRVKGDVACALAGRRTAGEGKTAVTFDNIVLNLNLVVETSCEMTEEGVGREAGVGAKVRERLEEDSELSILEGRGRFAGVLAVDGRF